MIVSRRFLCKTLSLLFVTGMYCSADSYAAESGSPEKMRWTMDIPASEDQWKTEDARTRIVIFRLGRDDDNYSTQPLNIFVNKEYHASLYPEHQAIGLSLCPGKSSLLVEPASTSKHAANDNEGAEILTPALRAGNVYFYQIAMDNSGKIAGRWVDVEQAKNVLSGVNIQAHTLSRVDDMDKCPVSSITFDSSALFELSQYGEQGLIAGADLTTLVSNIMAGYKTISKVEVKGYADPTGNAKSNLRLSKQRAKTIAEKLISAGLPSNYVMTYGMGSINLIVADCQKYKTRSEIIQCNQPNRRVEVAVHGIRVDER